VLAGIFDRHNNKMHKVILNDFCIKRDDLRNIELITKFKKRRVASRRSEENNNQVGALEKPGAYRFCVTRD